MAHSISAKKRDRQNARRQARNKSRKSVLKSTTRGMTDALAAHDGGKARDALKSFASNVDQAAARKTIHPNTAARRKSRMARRVNALAKGATK